MGTTRKRVFIRSRYRGRIHAARLAFLRRARAELLSGLRGCAPVGDTVRRCGDRKFGLQCFVGKIDHADTVIRAECNERGTIVRRDEHTARRGQRTDASDDRARRHVRDVNRVARWTTPHRPSGEIAASCGPTSTVVSARVARSMIVALADFSSAQSAGRPILLRGALQNVYDSSAARIRGARRIAVP